MYCFYRAEIDNSEITEVPCINIFNVNGVFVENWILQNYTFTHPRLSSNKQTNKQTNKKQHITMK